jgi:GxxExxY protein
MMVMIKEEYKYSAITEQIIGCAMKVHNTLGNGFQEVIYQRALALELGNAGLEYTREIEMPIHYNGQEIGTRRADFLIDGKIVVELKALTGLEDVHIAQGLNYLEAYKLEIGLLINFGSKKLEFKRLTNERKLHDQSMKQPS